MLNLDFLKELTEVPSVGTACGPVMNVLARHMGPGFDRMLVPDGFCLFTRTGAAVEDLEAVLVAHVDEIGGCAYGAHEGGFLCRTWGNAPSIFADATLQAYDWLAEDASAAVPVTGTVEVVDEEERLVLGGAGIRPYRTAFTFREETIFDGDAIEGKALDPRVTAYAVAEAVRVLDDRRVGALFVMAEECAMDVARKAVTLLNKRADSLKLVVNADVPGLRNLADSRLDLPAIRVYEGRNFIDPWFGIRATDRLAAKGLGFHLTGARSGSQTILFTPLAPTVSVALPASDVHLPRVRMSLTGTRRCIDLLSALAEGAVSGELVTP